MRYLVRLYKHGGDEIKRHSKIYEERPYVQEVKGYADAVESIADVKVAYFTIDEIYVRN